MAEELDKTEQQLEEEAERKLREAMEQEGPGHVAHDLVEVRIHHLYRRIHNQRDNSVYHYCNRQRRHNCNGSARTSSLQCSRSTCK